MTYFNEERSVTAYHCFEANRRWAVFFALYELLLLLVLPALLMSFCYLRVAQTLFASRRTLASGILRTAQTASYRKGSKAKEEEEEKKEEKGEGGNGKTTHTYSSPSLVTLTFGRTTAHNNVSVSIGLAEGRKTRSNPAIDQYHLSHQQQQRQQRQQQKLINQMPTVWAVMHRTRKRV